MSEKSPKPPLLEQQKLALLVLVAQSDKNGIRDFFAAMHPADAAGLVSQLLKREQKVLFGLLNASQAADVVEQLEPAEQVQVVNDMAPEQASDVVEQMESDKGVDLLQDLPPEKTEALLRLMEPEEAAQARELLVYPEESAGGLMAKEFIAIPSGVTVQEAIASLQSRAKELEAYPISYLYVLNGGGRLEGVVPSRDLILKGPAQQLQAIMISKPISVGPAASLSEVQALFDQYHLLALPVVDADGKMLGLISQSEVMERMHRDAGKGLLRFMGITGGEEYRDMPLSFRVYHRLPWLVVNIFLNLLSASVIAVFQDTLQQVVALAVFLPIVSDMSGCAGGQAVAVSIREQALGRLQWNRLLWVFRKELIIGFLNGFVLGGLVGLVGYLWKGMPYFGLVIALALWINTVFSVCLGGIIPVLSKKLRVDPAIAATPVLTTLTDALGFLLVMLLAKAFLPALVP